jgi:phospholipase/carboxylesterase
MTVVRITRRRFGAVTGGAFLSLAFGGACVGSAPAYASDGVIRARPRDGVRTSGSGSRRLGIGGRRDAILQLPAHASTTPLPLLVLFHGAGQNGAGTLQHAGRLADEAGIAVLAPDSRESTWDAIRGRFGADVAFVNRALERVFDTVAVDPARVAVGGFSDGATYALSLGLINGDLFPRVVAFSPGFIIGGTLHGKPRFFISHGTADPILPIHQCSGVIVPRLRKGGYEVRYLEFAGGHEVPTDVAREAMRWQVSASEAGSARESA